MFQLKRPLFYCRLHELCSSNTVPCFPRPGFWLVMTSSSDGARVGGTVHFSCVVTNTIAMVDVVDFLRRTSLVASLNQTGGQCAAVNLTAVNDTVSDTYSASCGANTENETSIQNEYTLNISYVTAVDFTNWWCRLKANRTRSNKVTLDSTGQL